MYAFAQERNRSVVESHKNLPFAADLWKVYKQMSDHNDIRYRVKVEKASDKVFIIMQVESPASRVSCCASYLGS
jgi:hypothetical protein